MAQNPGKSQPRQPGIALGRVFGVPVYLSTSWLFLSAIVTLVYGGSVRFAMPELHPAVAYVVAFGFAIALAVSVFLHELGHALAGRQLGIPARVMRLDLLGGHTEMERESPTPRVEALIALAGPAVSFGLAIIGGIGFALMPAGGLPRQLVFQFAFSNLIVAVFNVLPGLPLDGGRALRALVWAITGNKHRATAAAGWTGRAVAVLALAAAVAGAQAGYLSLFSTIFTAMIAVFLWIAASQAIRSAKIGSRVRLLDARALTRPAISVGAQTPLSEALRQAQEAQAGAIVVTDSAGTPTSVVNGHAAASVPLDRQPWMATEQVARAIQPGMVLDATLAGDELLKAIQGNPATEYVIYEDGLLIGVLRVSDVVGLLEPTSTQKGS